MFTKGIDITTTEPFTCDHVEWRIRWEVEPKSGFLLVNIHSDEESNLPFANFTKSKGKSNGTWYIHDRNGTFYLEILAACENYTLIIEQNLKSIPEYPTWLPVLILMVVLTVTAAIYNRKRETLDRPA